MLHRILLPKSSHTHFMYYRQMIFSEGYHPPFYVIKIYVMKFFTYFPYQVFIGYFDVPTQVVDTKGHTKDKDIFPKKDIKMTLNLSFVVININLP